MTTSKSLLENLSPIIVEKQDGTVFSITPARWIFLNIPMIWRIQESIVDEWQKTVAPYEQEVEGQNVVNPIRTSQVLDEIEHLFFRSLFSYAAFFKSLDEYYLVLYQQLGKLVQFLRLKVKKPKLPKKSDYINSVIDIRNDALAHPIKPKSDTPNEIAESLAQSIWSPQWNIENEKPDLLNMGFGDIKIPHNQETVESNGTQITIPEMAEKCQAYIIEYDQVCANYLQEIIRQLPEQHNSEYRAFFTDMRVSRDIKQ